jgi:hypothetical protein
VKTIKEQNLTTQSKRHYNVKQVLDFMKVNSQSCEDDALSLVKHGESSGGCNCGNRKFSSILNFALQLEEEIEDETVATQIITQLSPFFQTHYTTNPDMIRFCQRLWALCSRNKLSISFQDRLAKLNPQFLWQAFDKIMTECYVLGVMDITYLKINDNFQTFFQYCMRSNLSFQCVIDYITQKMIDTGFPKHYQTFLDEFLEDLRLEMLIKDFRNMYSNDMVKDITILDELKDSEDQRFPVEILEAARQEDYKKFVILITHNPKYYYLLKN